MIIYKKIIFTSSKLLTFFTHKLLKLLNILKNIDAKITNTHENKSKKSEKKHKIGN